VKLVIAEQQLAVETRRETKVVSYVLASMPFSSHPDAHSLSRPPRGERAKATVTRTCTCLRRNRHCRPRL